MENRITKLFKQRDQIESEIKQIRSDCSHTRVLHTEDRDVYAGWVGKDECMRCGKVLNAYTISPMFCKSLKPVRKIIRRDKKCAATSASE